MQEDRVPPGGVIRKHTLSSSGSSGELPDGHYGVIKVKEEPADSEDEGLSNPSLESEQSAYLHQVKGRLVIRAMIWKGRRWDHAPAAVQMRRLRLHPCLCKLHTVTHTQGSHCTVGQLFPFPCRHILSSFRSARLFLWCLCCDLCKICMFHVCVYNTETVLFKSRFACLESAQLKEVFFFFLYIEVDFSIKDVLWRGAWKQVYSFEKLPHLPVFSFYPMNYFRVPSSKSALRIVRCPHGE